MGITIGSASGAYGNEGIDAGKINPTEEDAERIAEDRREALEDQGIDPDALEGSMTGTLETSDPNNPQDADDVTPSEEDPSLSVGEVEGDDEDQVPAGATLNEDGQIVVNENADPDADPAAEPGTLDTTDPDALAAEGADAKGPDPETNPVSYDPADHTVGEVEKYLANASDEEKARVIEAESKNRQRKGILDLA